MSGMQEKVLNRIKEVVEANGLEFVQQAEWSNMGTVRVMKDFDALLGFGYDFQNSYATIWVYPGNKKIVKTCGFTDKNCILHWHSNYDRDMAQAVSRLVSFIDGWLEGIGEKEAL